MAFTAPTFNLLVDVYTGPWLSKVLRIHNLPANLQMARRSQVFGQFFDAVGAGPATPWLLVPAGSDVRDAAKQNIPQPDIVEVPAGTGRWYRITTVDDVGKGFPNEFRLCAMGPISQDYDSALFPGLWWPIPMP